MCQNDAPTTPATENVEATLREENAILQHKVSLLHDATIVLRNGMGGHNHWDNTMQHGSGCPVCIQQREARIVAEDLIERAAITRAPSPPPAGEPHPFDAYAPTPSDAPTVARLSKCPSLVEARNMVERTAGGPQAGGELLGIPDAEVKAAWETFCKDHIQPSDLFRIAQGMARKTDYQDRHLMECVRCRKWLEAYSGPPEMYQKLPASDAPAMRVEPRHPVVVHALEPSVYEPATGQVNEPPEDDGESIMPSGDRLDALVAASPAQPEQESEESQDRETRTRGLNPAGPGESIVSDAAGRETEWIQTVTVEQDGRKYRVVQHWTEIVPSTPPASVELPELPKFVHGKAFRSRR